MVEYDRHALKKTLEPGSLKTCIVGIGGAGGNVIDRITLERTVDAKLIAMHTDIRVLSHSMAPYKIQLGAELMRGVGAGGDPELGREAAVFSREQIREVMDGHDIIFLCTGLGGGTGSGAAPVVAEIAKSTGALVFLTATMPFSFEGKRRLRQAEDALDQLQKRADALILFENNRMGELILPKDGIQKAFTQADQLIAQSLRAVSTILTTPGLVKLGLDDLTSALNTSNGRCLFGFGEARGQNRGEEAVKRALKSPLIDQGRLLHQTRTLLVHIAGGESLTLLEVDSIMKQLGKNVPDQTHILFGVAVDAKLGDSICVTLLSSLGLAQLNTLAAAAPPSEMLPLHERPMPSMPDIIRQLDTPEVKPEPAQAQAQIDDSTQDTVAAPSEDEAQGIEIPVTPTPRPTPVKALPIETPKPLPEAASESMDLLFPQEEFTPTDINLPYPKPTLEPVYEDEDLFFQAAATLDKANEALARPTPSPNEAAKPLEQDVQDEPVKALSQEAEAEAPEPVKPKKLSVDDFVPIKAPQEPTPKTTLASVVAARTIKPTYESVPQEHAAYAPPLKPASDPSSGASIKSPGNGNHAPTPTGEQTAFRFGSEEDRGRFKETEPVLADGGEDLDVPTWMRLKRKLKR
jgi:cell division protein FtsZ